MPLNNSPTPSSCQHEKDPLDGDAVTEDDNDCKDVIKENIVDLPPVLAFSSGEGLPYAPEGWPSPDDVWGWKVGRRVNKAGYFHDRYLYLPKSLQRPRKSWSFQSKLEVIRYIQSNFPNMKIEAFFALFSWQVLSAEQSHAKAVQPLSMTPPAKLLETRKHAPADIGTLGKLKRKAQSCNQPTRKSFRLFSCRPRIPPVGQDENDFIDLCYLNEESSGSELDQPSCDSTVNFKEGSGLLTAGEKSPNVNVLENFDDYLATLEDILVMPRTEASGSNPMVPVSATTLQNETMEYSKKKLSSFLAMDFPSLVSSNNVAEVATLASQILRDPSLSLSVDEIAKLKLVEQIPLVSEAFLEAKGNIEEADEFFANLEAKRLEYPSLKNEYNELKNKVAQVESEMDKSYLAIQEIDDQILQLQSKRNELWRTVDTMLKSKSELISRQTVVVNSIPTIVHEIQLGLTEKPNWELKKANCAQRVAEIHDKFITLRGLTL